MMEGTLLPSRENRAAVLPGNFFGVCSHTHSFQTSGFMAFSIQSQCSNTCWFRLELSLIGCSAVSQTNQNLDESGESNSMSGLPDNRR
jgi:hypothetical protein